MHSNPGPILAKECRFCVVQQKICREEKSMEFHVNYKPYLPQEEKASICGGEEMLT
jgi:hypothetical protein